MEYFSDRIARLSPEKRALFDLRLKQKFGALHQPPPMGKRPDPGFAPLSFSQQRLWILDQLEPGNSAYNLSQSVRLRGEFKVEAMEQALTRIVERHESLRTQFVVIDGEPRQQILSPWPVRLEIVSLENLNEAEREQRAGELASQEALTYISLRSAPLFRAKLLRLEERDHVLLLTLHHIISDGWSMNVMVGEVSQLYEGFRSGEEHGLPELPIQYGDFAHWQRQWLQGEVLENQLGYWKKQLAGAPQVLDLKTDYPRPAIQSFAGAKEPLWIGEETTQRLKALCGQEGATLFMALLSAFLIMLRRHTGQEDILMGTPIAGRDRPEIEGLIGFFINSLVLRGDLSGNPTFRELLRRTIEVTFSAYAHQAVPFEKVLEAIQPQRVPGCTPLFQVFFNMHNLPDTAVGRNEGGGLIAEMMAPPAVESKFDMTLYASERGDKISLMLVYKSGLFSQDRMAEWMQQLGRLLNQIADDPDLPVLSYSLLTPASEVFLPNPSHPLDDQWEGAVHELFTRNSRKYPQRIAVKDEKGGWTYEEIEHLSNQLAHFLVEQGVKKGRIVAVYGARSASLVWTLLGIFKAGAAFLILDPAYPSSRLITYLRAAEPQGWLHLMAAGPAGELLEEFLAEQSFKCRLELPELSARESFPLLAAYPITPPERQVGPDDLAYISFTSGTAGKPKGVLGGHGSLTHFLPWQRDRFGLSEFDNFSMLSGLSHDPLHRDIFTPLMLGGSVCVPRPEIIGAPGGIARWLRQESVSVVNLTPALGKLIADSSAETTDCLIPSLRYAFFVGDVLTRHDVRRLRHLAPNCVCINHYGATETQRAVAYHVVSNEEILPAQNDGQPVGREIIPVGRGIKDVQLLVFNDAMKQAGIGEIGELYLRSPHLAKGYLNDEDLTRERFIVNPYTNLAGDRLYRTGDLGRYLLNGETEPLGRADFQVKIRGFRVEIGEIEGILVTHPLVSEAAVLPYEEAPGVKSLAAYIVSKPGEVPDFRQLRDFLAQRLPEYMIPASFISLDYLPLTPNKKLDRQALPSPGVAEPERQNTVFLSPVQEMVAGIWAKVLGRTRFGPEDNFFELGGHSLRATQVVSRLCDAFQVEFPLRKIFENPTLRSLAEEIEASLATTRGGYAPPIKPVSRENQLPLSFSQQRLWFLDQLEPGNAAYNLPTAIRLIGELDVVAFEKTLSEIFKRHEVLRTCFPATNGIPVQEINSPAPVRLEVQDLSFLTSEESEKLATQLANEEAHRPFNLLTGPLWRAQLFKLADKDNLLLFTMHHIISDGWSMGVLVNEVIHLYTAFLTGSPHRLHDLPVQYADYAVWQRELLQGDFLLEQLAYWKEKLANPPAGSGLPTDYPRPAIQS